MDGRSNDQELSLTIKYLLDNPALLQPPETNTNEKCKDDKTYDQGQQNDLPSAYLGPQIWSDMLLSDDLKLEPVDLDELLDTTGLEDEVGDLSSLMASPRPRSSPHHMQHCSADDPSQATYQDMPSLMSTHRSPDAKQVPSPSLYFHYPSPPLSGAEKNKDQHMHPTGQTARPPQQLSDMDVNRTQKLAEMQLFDQQFAILNDILASNHFDSINQPMQLTEPVVLPSQTQNPSYSPDSQFSVSPQQQLSKCPTQTPAAYTGASYPSPTSQPPPLLPHTLSNKPTSEANSTPLSALTPPSEPASSESTIEIRIPSPKRVAYIPNTTDVIISTPQSLVSEAPFDPRNRAFTEEELKPQPIIRKSKKVHVSADSKDGKYWSRRNKNNVAAKRSREARRIKENQIAMRANYLEQENLTLKTEITELRKELTKVVEVVKKYEQRYSTLQN